MKYGALYQDLYSVFSSPAWVAESINTYPENYVGDGGSEYIRVTPLASGESINIESVSGIIQIEIFVAAGLGPARGRQIADKLDQHLAGKTFTLTEGRCTQFLSSAFAGMGNDKDNPSLFRSLYSISFLHFGVQ